MTTTMIDPDPPTQSPPAERLRTTMAAARLSFSWMGVRKSLTATQKNQAADSFGAEGKFLSAGKKLLDTSHPAYKAVTAIRSQTVAYWKGVSLPFGSAPPLNHGTGPAGRFAIRAENFHRPHARPTFHPLLVTPLSCVLTESGLPIYFRRAKSYRNKSPTHDSWPYGAFADDAVDRRSTVFHVKIEDRPLILRVRHSLIQLRFG